ncbi:MAG: glycosyltransferase family 2 protein [Thermodesulfobacteriota bacterium]
MRISCILPTRDRALMVRRAIGSVLAQSRPCDEIVVVDDGSVDGTAEQLARLFPAVRLLRLPGVGPGRARNAGVAAATGEVLMFLDSDDEWTFDHVRRLALVMETGCEVAYGTARTIDQVAGGEFLIPDQGAGVAGDCFEALLRWCFLVPSAVAVRRSAFARVGGFVLNDLGEDWGLFLQLAQHYPFGFAGPEPVTIRYLHEGSQCRLRSRRTIIDAVASLRRLAWEANRREAARARFSQLLTWLGQKEEPWTTVHEWYLSMQRERLL